MTKFNKLFPFVLLLGLAVFASFAHSAEKVELRAGEHDGYARIAIDWKQPVTFETRLDGQILFIHFSRPFETALPLIARNLGHYVASATQSTDGKAIMVMLNRPVELKSSVVKGGTVAIDLFARPLTTPAIQAAKILEAKTKPAEKALPTVNDSKAAALHAKSQVAALSVVIPPGEGGNGVVAIPVALPAAEKAVPSDGAPAAMTPSLVLENERASIRFDWPSQVAAAVFRRGSALWIVFSQTQKLDLTALRARSNNFISAVDQVATPEGTALRLVVSDGMNPSVRRVGTSWIVDLKKADATADSPIVIEPRPTATVPSVELHVRDASTPLKIKDPVLNDKIVVVPVGELGRGVDITRSFVDFRLLPSVQGVVIRPSSDDLAVRSDVDNVEISRPRGLVLSGDRDRVLGVATTTQNRLFDFATWRGPTSKTFIEGRSERENAVAALALGARTQARLDLARFYFANQFGAETMSVLEQIEHDDAPAASSPAFHALKGAACLLAAYDACAKQELNQSTLDDEPEAAVWRGSLAAGKGDWDTASREFLRGVGLIPTYPKALRNRFALEAAEAMLETDRSSAAGPLVDLVLKDSPELGDKALALYLTGRREMQMGHLSQALEQWVGVSGMGDRKARARALYSRALSLYEAKKVNRVDSINALDSLRFSWRGDEFEFTLLRRLGELQLAEGDAENGIQALHEAAVYFPDYTGAKDVAKQSQDAFADLFIGKSADDTPPVKALALYEEFKDLEPTGERHDAIVRKLVDRLVSVDLLDQAAILLESQVKNNLAGREKVRGATQLALLRLMNRQPEVAVAALDMDVGKDVPTDIARQRQELRARALADLNRVPEALAMIASDDSRDADRLRADIFWRQRDWKNASKIFAALAGAPPAQGPLGPELSRIVLAWASALTLDNDQAGVAKLRESFGPVLAGTQTAEAFNFITDDGTAATKAGGSAADVATRIAEIGTLQSFMSAYKQRLASNKLSAIN